MVQQRPKIAIQKKFILDAKGHYRYRTANYVPGTKYDKKGLLFNLEPIHEYNKLGEEYQILNIQTERQLVLFLRNAFGYGEYRILAHLKGREGAYIFWMGEIMEDGWQAFQQRSDDKEIENLKDEMAKASSEEEAEALKEDISFFREISQEEKRAKRYGFAPFLRPSGKRGQFNGWEDADVGLISKNVQVQDVNDAW